METMKSVIKSFTVTQFWTNHPWLNLPFHGSLILINVMTTELLMCTIRSHTNAICYTHSYIKTLLKGGTFLCVTTTHSKGSDYWFRKYWSGFCVLFLLISWSKSQGRTHGSVEFIKHWPRLKTEGTFTHAQSGSGRKIGFNINHHMRSHIRGRGAEAEREQNPLRNKWVQHPIFRVHFETVLQTIFVLKKWQIRPRPLRVCVNTPALAERECQNPPVSALQPLRAYVNIAWELSWCQLCHHWGTVCCCHDNLQCCWWRKSWHHDNSKSSVYVSMGFLHLSMFMF